MKSSHSSQESSIKPPPVYIQALLAFFSLAVSLVIADIAIGFTLQVPSNYLKKIIEYRPDSLPHKRLKRNLDVQLTGAFREFTFRFRTDAEGFRRSEPAPMNSGKGRYDILFLGDSQTAGVGMEDGHTFASLTSKRLGKSVLNAGCYGYSTVESLQILRQLLKEYKPQWVVLNFFAGNDPYENYRHRFELEEGAAIETPAAAAPRPFSIVKIKEFLKKRSSIYNLFILMRKYPAVNDFLYRAGFLEKNPPMELVVYRKGEDALKADFWKATEKALLLLRDEAKANGAQLLLVNVPDRCDIDRDYWNGWLQKYKLGADELDLGEPARHLADFSARNEIPYRDLRDAFRREQEAGRRMYWLMDLHLSAAGNETVSEAVAGYLSGRFKA